MTAEAEPKYYLVFPVMLSRVEQEEQLDLIGEQGLQETRRYRQPLYEKFLSAGWPLLKAEVLRIIQSIEPEALLLEVDNARNKSMLLKPRVPELIEALRKLDQIHIREGAPDNTLEQFIQMFDELKKIDSDKQGPSLPTSPKQGAQLGSSVIPPAP